MISIFENKGHSLFFDKFNLSFCNAYKEKFGALLAFLDKFLYKKNPHLNFSLV